MWEKCFPHFLRFKPKRSMIREKEKILNQFDKKYLPKVLKKIPPNEVSEPTYYTLYIRSNRGKLFSLTYNILKYFLKNEESAFNAALGMEILSANSLILDDIFDNDLERQGCPAAHVVYGIRKAIYSVFYTNSKVFKINEKDEEIRDLLQKAWFKRLESFIDEEKIKKKEGFD